MQPDLVDQVLFDEDFDTEIQRKRTTSVSKMDRKDSAAPEEEDEDERPPMVNGLAGERNSALSTVLTASCAFSWLSFSNSLYFPQNAKVQDLFSFLLIVLLSKQAFSGLAVLRARSALNPSTAESRGAKACLRSGEATPRLTG